MKNGLRILLIFVISNVFFLELLAIKPSMRRPYSKSDSVESLQIRLLGFLQDLPSEWTEEVVRKAEEHRKRICDCCNKLVLARAKRAKDLAYKYEKEHSNAFEVGKKDNEHGSAILAALQMSLINRELALVAFLVHKRNAPIKNFLPENYRDWSYSELDQELNQELNQELKGRQISSLMQCVLSGFCSGLSSDFIEQLKDVIALLLSKGADVKQDIFLTPLHLIVILGDVELAAIFLYFGARIYVTCRATGSPLAFALESENPLLQNVFCLWDVAASSFGKRPCSFT